MTQILDQPPVHDQVPLNGGPSNGWLVTDYLRRIHWWIRLFGICFAVSAGLWLFAVVFWVAAAMSIRP